MTTDIALRPLIKADRAAQSILEFESPASALIGTPVARSAWGTVWTVASLVVATGVVLGAVPIDKVVTAHGRVVSLQPTVVVQPLETAIVRAITVREGQHVHAGEVLARLDPTFAAADMSSYEAQVASLQAEVDRLRAEAQGVPYRPKTAGSDAVLQEALYGQRAAEYRYHIENYSQKIDGLSAALTRAHGDVQAYRQRLAVAAVVEAKRSELEKLQVGSQINLLSAMDNRLEIQRALTDAIASEHSSERELAAMQAERDGYVSQWHAQASEALNDASRKLNDARENLRKARLRRQMVELRAERDAVVQSVARVSVGSVLQSGDQFITLVPNGAPLETEVKVQGLDAGWVRPGETATVKFDAFPYAKYGTAEGRVRVVSPDSFTTPSSDATQRGAVGAEEGQPTAPYYLGRVTIDEVAVRGVPDFRITPGMPVTVDMKVGRHTILGQIFSRVLPMVTEGMREP